MAEIVFLLVVLAVIAWFGMRRFFVRGGRQMSALLARGVAVTGTVTLAEHVRKARGEYVSELHYTFRTTGGIEYTRKIKVQPKDIQKFSVGQAIGVVYDASDPTVNMLQEQVDIARQAMTKAQAKI